MLLNCGNDITLRIEPIGNDSPASNALTKGGGLDHICYETRKFDQLYEKFKAKGFQHPKPAQEPYFNGGRFFSHSRRWVSGVP